MKEKKKEYNIFIVSNVTGRTIEQALNAALIQFPEVKVNLI